MEFTFLYTDGELPEGVTNRMSFEASTYLEALQKASDYWFGGTRVVDSDRVGMIVNLLSDDPQQIVIGTLIDYRFCPVPFRLLLSQS